MIGERGSDGLMCEEGGSVELEAGAGVGVGGEDGGPGRGVEHPHRHVAGRQD